MSSTYRKIEFDCDCGGDYGGRCEEPHAFLLWEYHSNSTTHIYLKENGKTTKLLTLEPEGREALIKLLTLDGDKLQPFSEKDWEEFEKVKFG